ncbi:hypothetical protein SCLCIDRAFT_24396 [Scleroderma citrinum Foug A]|uniref:Uncharacterized protein n=1 Tax=Scleroderma citrinum Foug A TaxID=1036808 RepID=A0A0C3E5F8_9AGAM|nr:hypothetical protein SCLCIDRAFT_24396 [Scleroderma citrinum Foug A]
MSAPSKSNTPTPATTTQSKDWMKAATLELNAGTNDETKVVFACSCLALFAAPYYIVMAKQGERKWHKQARLAEQERQRREQEEAEHKVREEVECKVKEEAERKAADER